MATWRKGVLLTITAVVGLVPTFNQLSFAQTTSAQEVLVTLPKGGEISDVELLQVKGEALPYLVKLFIDLLVGAVTGAFIGAGVGAMKAQWFDEEHGIDNDDLIEDIAFGAEVGAWCGFNYVLKRTFIPI